MGGAELPCFGPDFRGVQSGSRPPAPGPLTGCFRRQLSETAQMHLLYTPFISVAD
jgi:hypothetical protein